MSGRMENPALAQFWFPTLIDRPGGVVNSTGLAVSTTTRPLTMTVSIPVVNWQGSSNVALSVIVFSLKIVRSANEPLATVPRSGSRNRFCRVAGHFVDGLFECVQLQIADHGAKESSGGTKDSWMHRAIAAVNSVGAHHEEVVLQERVNQLVVALVEDKHPRRAALRSSDPATHSAADSRDASTNSSSVFPCQ